jgi:hypothetical protein
MGKVKRGVQYGASLFNKGRNLYNDVKVKAINLPMVGPVANTMIGNAEDMLDQKVRDKTGYGFRDVARAVGTAERLSNYLPNS